MNISITCTGCSKAFSSNNLPRISTRCYHTYCEYCLTMLHACPMDRQPFEVGPGMKEFPVNRSLAKLMGLKMPEQQTEVKPKDEKEELCLLHGKEADLVCIDHGTRICSNCALFGQHKQHRIKTVDNVIEECTQVAEQTVGIMTEIQNIQQRTTPSTMNILMEQAFRQKRENLSKTIRSKFYRIIDRLKRAQQVALQQLDDMLNQEKAAVWQSYKPDEMSTKRKQWFRDAEELGVIVDMLASRRKVEEATSYVDEKQEQSRIARRGQYLIVEMNSSQKLFFQRVKTSLDDICQETDAQFQSMVNDYCKIFSISSRNRQIMEQPQKTERNDDEFLLEELSRMHTIEAETTSLIEQPILKTEPIEVPALILIQKTESSVPSSAIERSERFLQEKSFIKEKEPLSHIQNPENKKKKKLKIPQKYESIVEDLRCDKSDCIDLTNAELGDAVILQLCDYIRNTTKLRSLKLIRNKISDQTFIHILEACSESKITSLNMGQNLLSDKALEYLSKCELKDLRTITLSQNKINQRNCKNKVADFKKLGITVSL